MRESYAGLFAGMALAVVLVYLFLVINFQSWIDPLIVLMAVPFALGGVMWMLFLTGTHLSVPALMGTLMCIGLTTANSILVVTFANQRMDGRRRCRDRCGDAPGYTRLRPVLMTAGAMILGMIPMALGVGEGGEQNAPLAAPSSAACCSPRSRRWSSCRPCTACCGVAADRVVPGIATEETLLPSD